MTLELAGDMTLLSLLAVCDGGFGQYRRIRRLRRERAHLDSERQFDHPLVHRPLRQSCREVARVSGIEKDSSTVSRIWST
jgi:hypothetical protein